MSLAAAELDLKMGWNGYDVVDLYVFVGFLPTFLQHHDLQAALRRCVIFAWLMRVHGRLSFVAWWRDAPH